MFNWEVYRVITLEISTNDFIEEILKLVENRQENLTKRWKDVGLVSIMQEN